MVTTDTGDRVVDGGAVVKDRARSKAAGSPPKPTCSQTWSNSLQKVRRPIERAVCQLSMLAARNPWTTVVTCSVLTIGLLVTGIFTNISFESEDDVLFTPFGSLPPVHRDWIDNGSDFSPILRDQNVMLHQQGANIMEDCPDALTKAFDVMEALVGLEQYNVVCAANADADGCPWSSITQFFNNSRRVFEASPSFGSNEECLAIISGSYFPNGEFVLTSRILGNSIYNNESGVLVSADSTFHILGLPLADSVRTVVEEYEAAAIDTLFDTAKTWNDTYVLEQFNDSSFSIEFGNGFLENIPYLAAAFALMTLFTAGVYWKCDPVESRVAVGLGATATVTMGMAAAFGLLFICGVPMTSIHGILPFILVGVGLDDAFIITNEFYRMPPNLPIEDRILKTIEEVGLSIVTTTVTSAVAFGLGCISTIPAVYWLCLYAFPAIIVDFFFAVTLFVAILVLDERRVEQRRRDVFCCFSAKAKENPDGEVEAELLPEDTIIDRVMVSYASYLMNPAIKGVVILAFAGLFAACVYSTTQLRQEFTVELVLPSDTYVVPFLDSLSQYTTNGESQATLYFRNIDHSTVEGQQVMEAYVNDMVALEGISSQPEFFWLRDFQSFVQNKTAAMEGLSFNDQIASFLDVRSFHALYDKDIARNDQGEVTASRVTLAWDLVDPDDVTAQINALNGQERTAGKQPVNGGGLDDGRDWSVFSFDDEYFIWSFFKACPEELALTVIMGVVAVSLISIVAIPHWSAIFFSAPLIMVLYVDLMGILQFAGITINSVSYITLAVSIGLMVDFLIHILLRYFESDKPSREEKVEDTLHTMGASVAIGGFTTFLGVLPLAFNTTGIFEVVFVTFVSLVVLGLSHGLILLPVLLSIFGSEDPVLVSLKEGTTFDKPNMMMASTDRAGTREIDCDLAESLDDA